ncbi:MAG: LysE family translocator [Cognatishimia sp.]|uniref:LysE family translocator n=1 Tax=Cognatishimia sp. TaxID=2211648 RepID=UPI004058453C
MSIDVWIVYVLTVLALMSTPGPSQLLMLSNSGVHGLRKSLFTAAGDLSANALQMLAAGLGLAALIAASANALFVIKWAGVAYLIWLGVRMIRKASSAPASVGAGAARASRKSLLVSGLRYIGCQSQGRGVFRGPLSTVHL